MRPPSPHSSPRPPLALIVAKARNNVIGVQGGLPWHLPEDLKFFKQKTLNNPVIMGRKTYQSIGFLLPNRLNIIVTRDPDKMITSMAGENDKNLSITNDLRSAIDIAHEYIATYEKATTAMIIGGGEIYKQAMPLADILYVTDIDTDISGDTYFPDIDGDNWILIEKSQTKGGGHIPHYHFCTYQRKR